MANSSPNADHGRKPPANDPVVRLTETAVQQVKTILEREKIEDHGLRVSVVGGGCSGFSYGLDFENQKRPDDLVVKTDGVTVYLDPVSAKYLNGTVIDFVGGLYGGGFKFTNPNVSSTCGCGTSFSV